MLKFVHNNPTTMIILELEKACYDAMPAFQLFKQKHPKTYQEKPQSLTFVDKTPGAYL